MSRWPLHIWIFTALVISLYLPYFFSSLSILILVIYSIIRAKPRRPRERFLQRYRLPILFTAYYLLALISVFYSENKSDGWGALGNMTSFLVLPWAIVSFSVAEQQQMLRKASQWFIFATLIVGVYFYGAFLFLNTGVLFLQSLLPQDIIDAMQVDFMSIYELSAGYMHPGYLSMYIGIALMMTLSKLVASQNTSTKILYVLVALVFFWLMFLVQSRMSLFALVLVSIAYVLSFKKIRRITIPIVSGIVLITILAAVLAPKEITGRYLEFDSLEYSKSDEDFNGITARLAIWDDVIEVGKKSPLFGVGIGDYRSLLLDQFKSSGFNKGILNKLDPHNQYLNTWISIGIPGLSVLLLIFYYLIIPGIKKGNYLSAALALFVALTCVTESILIRHWGITMLCSLVFISSNLPLRKKEEYAIEKAKK